MTKPAEAAVATLEQPSDRRVATDSLARLTTDLGGLALGLVATVMTARWLGPAGKGVLASLSLLGLLAARVFVAGLGDALIVQVGRHQARERDATRASVGLLLMLAPAGTLACLGIAWLVISPETSSERWAVAVVASVVPLAIAVDFMSHLLALHLRIREASVVSLTIAATSTALLPVFLGALGMGVDGAVLAAALGVAAAFLVASAILRKPLSAFRPRRDYAYWRMALAYGVRLEISHVMTLMAGRFDLLLVLVLAGAAESGFYSIALTGAAVVGMVPFALSFAVFPRLSAATEERSARLTAESFRVSIGATISIVVAFGCLIPLIFPLLFGQEFDPAVIPAVVALPAGALAGLQWLLGRASASRGDPNVLLQSFGLSLVVMIAADSWLVTAYGALGASIGYGIAALAGMGWCLRAVTAANVSLRDLVPRSEDLLPWALARRLSPALTRKPPVT